ncbi:MAG: HlyD family efflux transporter periplasmic adaptor subunit [Candidatus Solibacter usitatus]|nr:HlyD family efflux transporter periplasmic adaptor subunit [Candidatus Solibacter usitatus]
MWPKALLILGSIAAGVWAFNQFYLRPLQKQAEQKAAAAQIRTAKVVVGPFERLLRIGGTTGAREYSNITAPRMRGFESRSQMELLRLVGNGSWVKKNDELAQIDPGTQTDHMDDIRATITQAGGDVKKREAEQSVEIESLMQTLRVAKASGDKTALDLKAAEVRTDVERELLKLSNEEALAKYKQSQLDMPQKKLIHAAEVKILGFTTERHVRHLGRHEVDIKAYTIRAPMEGMVALANIYRGGGQSQAVSQGDPLGSGQPLLKIVNPKSMQLDANANQAESSEVRIGMPAIIGLDAFPDVKLPGRIYSIGALAVGGWRQNYYIRNVPVKLTIDGIDAHLIPDLSAHADVVVESQTKATLVPLGAIRNDGKKTYVEVKQGEQFVRREITVGSQNNLHAVATAGLSGGEEVRLN